MQYMRHMRPCWESGMKDMKTCRIQSTQDTRACEGTKLDTRACRVQDTRDTRHGRQDTGGTRARRAQGTRTYEAQGKYSKRACEAHNLADSYFTNF